MKKFVIVTLAIASIGACKPKNNEVQQQIEDPVAISEQLAVKYGDKPIMSDPKTMAESNAPKNKPATPPPPPENTEPEVPAAVKFAGQGLSFVDVKTINKKLKAIDEHLSPKEVAKVYYDRKAEEGERISMQHEEYPDGSQLVVIEHTGLKDDSVAAEKHILQMKRKGTYWQIMHIMKNWKCREGRGSTTWNSTPCS